MQINSTPYNYHYKYSNQPQVQYSGSGSLKHSTHNKIQLNKFIDETHDHLPKMLKLHISELHSVIDNLKNSMHSTTTSGYDSVHQALTNSVIATLKICLEQATFEIQNFETEDRSSWSRDPKELIDLLNRSNEFFKNSFKLNKNPQNEDPMRLIEILTTIGKNRELIKGLEENS
ncbi:MAG: hypothetical protein S4CHLAM6_04060 [Chlamydiae bacterium]|nr:hypothetical protein [Chlamydiota bacterium]